jgi:PAS domain-containing protein
MKSVPPPTSGTRLATLTKAELIARIESLPCAPSHRLDACPADRLNSVLRTQHVELEAQNLELRESRQRTEEMRDRYSDLYDFAPVGYLALDRKGCIREINHSGAAMLGCNARMRSASP